jgi:hypothetical protein
MDRITLEDGRAPASPAREGALPLRRSPAERVAAWALTGPPGRAAGFALDMASAIPMLARYWLGRVKDRRRDHSSEA